MDQSQPESKSRLDSMLTKQPDRSAVCPSHGPYTAKHVFGKIWSYCPVCEEDRATKEREAKRAADEALERERLQKRMALSGLVGRFQAATFENFETSSAAQEHVKTACRNFVESLDGKSGGLWLVGPPGTGKTHLGSAMVNYVIREQKKRAAIQSAREIVRMLRATWASNREPRSYFDERPATEEGLIEFFGSLQLLVLDEVGVSYGSDSETVQLFDVLDLRYRNELPTVLLSNLPVGELKGALGDRAYDRLREGAILVPCKWESRRSSGSAA